MNKGFTKFNNSLLEAIMRADFNGTEMKVLITIVRYTYGYQRKAGTLSAACISVLTGKSIRCVKYALKSLTEKKVILKFTENNVNSYSVNDITQWEGYEKLHFSDEVNCTDTVKEHAQPGVQQTAHNKENINKNIKDNYINNQRNFDVPTPKATKFNNFTSGSNIDYHKLELAMLRKRMERKKTV